jgi:hypothetical protein
MKTAVDNWPASVRFWTIAPASQLPTARATTHTTAQVKQIGQGNAGGQRHGLSCPDRARSQTLDGKKVRTWNGTLRTVIAPLSASQCKEPGPRKPIWASGRVTALTGRIHDRSRPLTVDALNFLPKEGRPYMTRGGWHQRLRTPK